MVFNDPQIIAVRADHPFAAGFNSDVDKLTNDQLASQAWVLPRVGTPGRIVFEPLLAAKDIRPPARVVECGSVIAIRALLLQTGHAALLSRHQVAHEIATGQLKIMDPPLSGSARPIGITTRHNTHFTRLQSAFLDAARRTCPGAEQYGKRG